MFVVYGAANGDLIDAFTRNMEAQAKVQQANAEREQGRYKELFAVSTVYDFANGY